MLTFLLFLFSLSWCATPNAAALEADPFLWLEEIESARSLQFVKQQNEATFARLKNQRYQQLEQEVRKIALAKDRMPSVFFLGEHLYNLWQDANHSRGLLRRTSVPEFAKEDPHWETVLDLDQLAKQEKENWVWKGIQCLEPENHLCMLHLSRAGKDAKVSREFDLREKQFVLHGFVLPEAKSNLSWIDSDRLLVETDFGPVSMSHSGYPIISKIWSRHTDLSEAVELFHGEASNISVRSRVSIRAEGTHIFVERNPSIFEAEVYYRAVTGRLFKVPFPKDASFETVFLNRVIYRLRSPLVVNGQTYAMGALVALPIPAILMGDMGLE